MTARAPRRSLVAALAGFAVALSGLAVVSIAPAQADVSTKISVFPYGQDWSDTGLITTNDIWTGVVGIEGYRGDDLTTATGADPQTLTGASTLVTDVNANQTNPDTFTTGGVTEFETQQAIALAGSGTADAPHVVFHLDLTGQTGTTFSFDAKDLDGSIDDAVQPIAVQYRVGDSGEYINLPDAFIADASTGPSLATAVTHEDVALPGATNGQADVFVRVMTTNAGGNDEWIGIDNIAITTGAGPGPLTATDPADVEAMVGTPIAPINLQASGGTEPYSWGITGLPAGLDETSDGVIEGTPTTEGMSTVTATVTDSADPVDTDDVTFTITVSPALAPIPIAEIQGDGDVSPLLGDPVITEGVVTAAYPAGGFFGFYLQTEGTGGSVNPATRTTSDGIFVRQTFDAGAVTVQPGDFVQVSGEVTEFAGQTQVEVTDAADIVPATGTPDPVTPVTTTSWPNTDAEKEALEGMLFSPQGTFTVSNTFGTNTFGEVGLALGNTPLIQPTEVENPHIGDIEGIEADNAARAIVLDDGSTTNFNANSFSAGTCGARPVPCLLNGDLTPPYISNDDPVRVGAPTTFTDDVILTEGGSPSSPTYRFQPLETVVGPLNAESPATFADTRTPAPDAAAIDPTGAADLKIASFNVLNYFTTLGDPDNDNVGDGGCLAYYDRDDDGTNNRTGCDPRGAWDPEDLDRQQEKIVAAINALDADVIGLMEIENSAKLGETADEATMALVAALNADAGAGTWAANPSSADLPPLAEQDVITNAIIYKPAAVDRVGPARALGEHSGEGEPFSNAREPIAQAFQSDGGGEPFLVVVNHFKSKGSGVDDGTGQGNANPDRIAQAKALRDWTPSVETDLGVEATFLLGDFNAYTMEDPMRVLYAAGYTDVAPEGEYSYSFSGLSGSLDHVVADPEALAMVTGSDIWDINSGESVALEYSRWNYHSTDFHDPGPYRSSDHDPLVVGLDVAVGSTAVTASAGLVTYGVPWNAAVTVTPSTATGDVEILDGERSLGTATLTAGSANVPISGTALVPGTHTLTVNYLGDATHAPSTNTFTVTVQPPPNETTVTTLSVAQMVYGTPGSAAITVIGSNPATGTVELREGATLIGTGQLGADGKVAIAIPGTALSVGAHNLTASYLGDANSDPSQATAQVQVAKADSSTSLSVSPGEAVVGQDQIVLNAMVSATGVSPTGSVVFSANGVEIGTAPVSGGQATLTIGPGHTVASYVITATYQGDANVATSTSPSADLEVVKADVRIRTKVVPRRVIAKETKPVLGIAIEADGQVVTGKVRVSWRGKTRTLTLRDGAAVLNLGKWKTKGLKKVRIAYLGSSRANPQTKVIFVKVRPKPRK